MKKPIPPQITRLILLTVTIVVGYGTARYLLTPASFGEFGFYRGDALAEIAARTPKFAGQESCAECHEKQHQELTKFEHKTLNCETCHGAASAHVADNTVTTTIISDQLCGRCHGKDPAKPVTFKQIDLKDHYSGSCKECHLPHHPSEAE